MLRLWASLPLSQTVKNLGDTSMSEAITNHLKQTLNTTFSREKFSCGLNSHDPQKFLQPFQKFPNATLCH